MSTSAWIAGSVRARALVRRRIGAAAARRIAAAPTAAAAVHLLADTPYGRDVHSGQDPDTAERALTATVLWHLRVLAGWLPPGGVEPLRALASWYEVVNIDEHVRRLTGRPTGPPYRLGALSTAWGRVSATDSLEAVRATLAASSWGDPGAAQPRDIALGIRIGWAERVVRVVPAAEAWVAGAVALLAAREAVAGSVLPAALIRRLEALLGKGTTPTGPVGALVAALPARGAWVFADGPEPDRWWRAEARWWHRIERDGLAMLTRHRFGLPVVVGATAVLTADAWRTRAALVCAARGGQVEVFDELA
ncbi:hypothetical protein [Virgisporangium ochraceum]|uniref:Uncharacterized protein n=1 Tax=Virgisporangium ochraceum TaxID=65505 RepID=A0A8J3ZWR3_9ACTN|nr:hypothetical protein [Virgisporangium ochraceum]GIJ71537.1 hypothetical protein Voc01_064540 [Virgisporangium ochraceum]